MEETKILSFEEYRKKKYGSQCETNALTEVLNRDLREQKDLLDWLSFHSSFNKYKLFAHMLFRGNHNPNNHNPNAGFITAFSQEHLERHANLLFEALNWESRSYIHIKAAGHTFRELGEQLCGFQLKSNGDAYNQFRNTLLTTDKVIVIQEISKSKIVSRKSACARMLIKISDDAHFDNIVPRSDLIFIDYAIFLQKSWEEIGPYLDVIS